MKGALIGLAKARDLRPSIVPVPCGLFSQAGIRGTKPDRECGKFVGLEASDAKEVE